MWIWILVSLDDVRAYLRFAQQDDIVRGELLGNPFGLDVCDDDLVGDPGLSHFQDLLQGDGMLLPVRAVFT